MQKYVRPEKAGASGSLGRGLPGRSDSSTGEQFVRLPPCSSLEQQEDQLLCHHSETSLRWQSCDRDWSRSQRTSLERTRLERLREKEREARMDQYHYGRLKRNVCRLSLHVRVLWTVLSVLVTVTCGFSFLQPFWVVNMETHNSLGMYNYCMKDLRTKSIGLNQISCGIYGRSFDLSNLPSNAWQIACVLYGGGCAMLCFGVFTAFLSVCVTSDVWSSRLASYTGYIQTMAVVTLIGGVIIFPMGLDSQFVRLYCPESRMYWTGSCSIGWAYMLGIMGTALAVFCPYLSQFTDFKGEDRNTLYV